MYFKESSYIFEVDGAYEKIDQSLKSNLQLKYSKAWLNPWPT